MSKKRPSNPSSISAWKLDQTGKSLFFHRKSREWQLIEIADAIENINGENLSWNNSNLNILDVAWNKVIHADVKPVMAFAHPQILHDVPRSVSYYRMLSMASQKSMKNIGLNLDVYEGGRIFKDYDLALSVSRHLNGIISLLVEASQIVNIREFILWQAMAAGTQAQGSWVNYKGAAAEKVIREFILGRLRTKNLLVQQEIDLDDRSSIRLPLSDNRQIVFSKDPDVSILKDDVVQVAIEVKGGIDAAGVLERVGATFKSLRRLNSDTETILILPEASMTSRAEEDLKINAEAIKHIFGTTALLEDETERERFFALLNI